MPTPSIVWYADKDQGPRTENQDAVRTTDLNDTARRNAKGVLLVLCDGVGGEKGGQRASAIASETAFNAYYADSTQPPQALHNAIDAAHAAVRATAATDSTIKNMATTIVTLAVIADKLYAAHVGDSRAYLLRGDTLSHLTKDHNWVAEQVARGVMTAQEGRVSTQRNIITRSLGAASNHNPDITSDPITLLPGDRLMICSDGLHGAVLDEQIKAILLANPLPQKAVMALIKAAKDNHTTDNISSIVLNYGSVGTPAGVVPFGVIGAVIGIIVLLALATVVIGSMNSGGTNPTPNAVGVTATRRASKRATSVAQGTDANTIPTDPSEDSTAESILPGQATVTADLRNSPTPVPIIPTATPTARPTETPTIAPTAPPVNTPRPTDPPKPNNTQKPANTAVPPPTNAPATAVPPTIAPPTAAPVATAIPTIAPVATAIPTVAPVATAIPTVAPVATAIPTVAPVATAISTVAPAATVAPPPPPKP